MPSWVREDREERPPIYWYKALPGPIHLDGMPVRQKGKTFFVVTAPAVDLDRLCAVPVIRYETTNSELALDALAPWVSRWQRELDPARTRQIAQFFRDPLNELVNAALIGLPNSIVFHTNNQMRSTATIPVTWPKKKCPTCGWLAPRDHPHFDEWFDACPDPECAWEGRPGQIIDGQHRIRGCAAAGDPYWNELLVASVLVDGEFTPMEEAKIFTEITTSAVDLHALHKVYLLYKFGLRSTDIGALPDADFRRGVVQAGANNTLGMRNRRAYEITSDLVSNNNSRFYDRISMFPGPGGRGRRGDLIDADVMVYFVEQWLRNGPLDDQNLADKMMPAIDAAGHLKSFIEAVLSTWPAGAGTPPGTSSTFWYDGRAQSGRLQLRGIFEVFLSVFAITSRRIRSHGVAPSKAEYLQEVSYIEPINWDDSAWYDLASPDMNKYLLERVLDHLYQQAPFPVGAARVPARVNAWMHEKPDQITFTVLPPANRPIATATKASPVKFSWDSTSPFATGRVAKPVNAYDKASILIEQDQKGGKTEILFQNETIRTIYSIESPPSGLDTGQGAAPVRITVKYSNLNGSTSATFNHPAI
jgi:hypothetical protein